MKAGKIILIIFLIVSLLLGVVAFIVPGGLSTLLFLKFEPQEEEKSPIFNYEYMSIELTTDFQENPFLRGWDAGFTSDNYEIFIDKVTITSETPAGGFTLSHLEEFMKDYLFIFITNDPDHIDIYEADGILYYDSDDDRDGDIDFLFAMYICGNDFWTIKFRPINSTFEESKEQFVAWSKNVTFLEE